MVSMLNNSRLAAAGIYTQKKIETEKRTAVK